MSESHQQGELPAEIEAALPMLPPTAKVGFLKAVGYLFGGVANYLAAWARRSTQSVDDKTDAKSEIVKAVAAAAAKNAATDPQIVEAAVNAWLPRELRKQENKASVVAQAALALSEDSEQITPEGVIEDDWLNSFERFCEDASSEKMQQLWGRVLAGEVKNPGSFSKTTIRFLSELDQGVAKSFEALSGHIISGNLFLLKDEEKKENLSQLLELESAGLITGVSGYLSWTPTIDPAGIFHLSGNTHGLVGHVSNNEELSVEIMPLSKIGRQILSILPEQDETNKLREIGAFLEARKPGFVDKAEISGVALCTVVHNGRERSLRNLELLWGANPFEDLD